MVHVLMKDPGLSIAGKRTTGTGSEVTLLTLDVIQNMFVSIYAHDGRIPPPVATAMANHLGLQKHMLHVAALHLSVCLFSRGGMIRSDSLVSHQISLWFRVPQSQSRQMKL